MTSSGEGEASTLDLPRLSWHIMDSLNTGRVPGYISVIMGPYWSASITQ